MTPEVRRSVAEAALLALAALVLLVPALNNGYPFLMSDTWAYIHHGFLGVTPWDRPAAYGLFIRASSLRLSPWFTIIVQALLTAEVIRTAFRLLTTVQSPGRAAVATAIVTTAATGLGLNAGLILPDVFAPLVLLALSLILVAPSALLTVRDILLLGGVIVLGNATHLAHLTVATLVVIAAVAYRLAARRLGLPSIAWRRLGLASVTVALSWLAVPTVHAATGAGFRVSFASPVFLLGRMAENGMLTEFLTEACPQRQWRLCQDIETIPQDSSDFLWGPNEVSPFQRSGGATPENIQEYGEIFSATLRSPRWVARHLAEGLVATARQLFLTDPTVILYLWLGSAVPWAMTTYFPADNGEFLHARQQRQTLSVKDWLPGVQRWMLLVSTSLLLLIYLSRDLRRSVHPPVLVAGFLLALGLLANAAVCGGLSIPHDRYQGRVIPLVPILVALIFARRSVRVALARWLRERVS
jgi:hypothetical protein